MDDLRLQFKSQYSKAFFLDYDVQSLSNFLKEQAFLLPQEEISKLEKPGEGNMNFVLRVITNQRTFIAKQARPWVEKYPQIAAPINRNEAETAYYSIIQDNTLLNAYSPKLLQADKTHFIAFYSDLGSSSDFNYLYRKEQKLTESQLTKLLKYLYELHKMDVKEFPENKDMRELNHEHIFNYPFQENNGFDLDAVQPGLAQLASSYKTDEALKEKIADLGKLYLGKGNTLIHGDFYPGSWLSNESGMKIIDPEFSFMGYAEFDLGVLVAHLFMTGHSMQMIDSVFALYQEPQGFQKALVAGFAGTEILRRILGVAQLPLSASLSEKESLLQTAANWINEGKLSKT